VDVPLYLTLGVAAVAAKASIALFTLMVFGPWIGLSWKARRSLADATAVQLTRDPDALARAVARMEGRTVAIEGADPVSFLFPFWTRWTAEVVPKGDDVTSNLVRMHLPLEKRLGALLRLGASPESIADAPATKDDPTTARDVLQLAGMTLLAVALVGACIAFSFLTMALVLWGLWALLQLIFFWSD
jgi:hypothetical protein